MNNPYLKEFKTLMNRYSRGEVMFFPERERLVKKYSWAIPNEEAIEKIVSYSPVIEIGAGNGYWASLVAGMGGEILAYDQNERSRMDNSWHVRLGSTEQIPLNPVHTLFLCWPPYDTSLAFDCLLAYQGDTVIYVGEGDGGCTGDDDFFIFLEANYELVETIEIPHYPMIHDRMFIYKRLKP